MSDLKVKCPKCGKKAVQIMPEKWQCPRCGTVFVPQWPAQAAQPRLPGQPPSPQQPPAPGQPATTTSAAFSRSLGPSKNKLGWILAGMLVIVVAVVVLWMVFFPSRSKPTITTLKAGYMDLKDINDLTDKSKDKPIGPSLLMPAAPTGEGNAADDYVKAVQLAKTNERLLTSLKDAQLENNWRMTTLWTKSAPLKDAERDLFKQIDQFVAAGAAKADMKYLFVHTPKEFKVGMKRGLPTNSFQLVGNALEALAADYKTAKQYREAEAVLYHELVMGWHLMNERVRPQMTLRGVELQAAAVRRLEHLYVWESKQKSDATFPSLKRYMDALQYMNAQALDEKFAVVYVMDQERKVELGDVYNVAENDKDLSWRVQSMLMLGLYQFSAADSRGDRKYITEMLQGALSSGNEFERAAAKAALEFPRSGVATFLTDDKEE